MLTRGRRLRGCQFQPSFLEWTLLVNTWKNPPNRPPPVGFWEFCFGNSILGILHGESSEQLTPSPMSGIPLIYRAPNCLIEIRFCFFDFISSMPRRPWYVQRNVGRDVPLLSRHQLKCQRRKVTAVCAAAWGWGITIESLACAHRAHLKRRGKLVALALFGA